ncbi:MAG: hypothetical protein IJX93_05730 [Clostridia bacterium]|nr:hypothetical protein [Clostridia bacterium]
MKKFVCLCICTALLYVLAAGISATGMTLADGAVTGSGGAAVSEQLAPTDDAGTPFDSGNNARTGDAANNGGINDGTAGGTANGEIPGETGSNGDITDNSANAPDYNTAPATESENTDAGSMTTGTSWFAVILSIIIVAAIIALVVALLPKRRHM